MTLDSKHRTTQLRKDMAQKIRLPKFGPELKKRREALELTPSAVAKKAGVSLAGYCNIEEGRWLPSLAVYQNLCKALNISAGKLLDA